MFKSKQRDLSRLSLLSILFISSAAAQVSPENGPSDETGYDDGSIPGSISYVGPEGEGGSAGSSKGSVNLSTGAQIAIIVVAVVVAIVAIVSAVLWYLAKKRQWQVRASIRRSARRVAESVRSPVTGKAPQWPSTPKSRNARFNNTMDTRDSDSVSSKETGGPLPKVPLIREPVPPMKLHGPSKLREGKGAGDLEKGFPLSETRRKPDTTEDAPAATGWRNMFSRGKS